MIERTSISHCELLIMGTPLHDRLLESLEASQDHLSPQQLKAFSVMCYRMVELFLSEEAKAAVDWVAGDLTGQLPAVSFDVILQALQQDVIDPDASRASENRFSFNVLKLLEESPLVAAKAALSAVAEAARLQALHKGSQGEHGEAITEFDQHLVRSQVNGLLRKIETNLSSVNLQNNNRTTLSGNVESER